MAGVTLLPVRRDFSQRVRLLQVETRQFHQLHPATQRVGRRRRAQLLQFGIGKPVECFPDGKLVFQLRLGIGQQGVKLHALACTQEITELLLVGDGAQPVQLGLVGAVFRHLQQQLQCLDGVLPGEGEFRAVDTETLLQFCGCQRLRHFIEQPLCPVQVIGLDLAVHGQ